LRDIQAEEEARQQEEDFLRWWAVEEERVKSESEAMSRALTESQTQASKLKRKGKGGKGIGRAKLDKPLQRAEEPGMEGREQQRGSTKSTSKTTRPKKNEVPNA
jgi:inhibitor of Bruton tyrosine kinase